MPLPALVYIACLSCARAFSRASLSWAVVRKSGLTVLFQIPSSSQPNGCQAFASVSQGINQVPGHFAQLSSRLLTELLYAIVYTLDRQVQNHRFAPVVKLLLAAGVFFGTLALI